MPTDARKFLGIPWQADLLILEDIHQDWLIDGLLPAMGRGLITAQWKTGKSLLALQLAHSLALGEDFLGLPTTRPRRVHYIDGEVGPYVMQDRLRRFAEAYPGAAKNIVITMFPQGNMVDAAMAVEDVDLVIIDPAIKLGYENENDNAQVRKKLDEVSDAAMYRLGASVLVVHHTRKPGREAGSQYQGLLETRGAGAFVDWVDMAVGMLKVGDEFRVEFVTRASAPPNPMILERDEESLTYSIRGREERFQDVLERVVEEWQGEGHTGLPGKEEVVARLQSQLHIGRSTAYRKIKGFEKYFSSQ